MKTVTRQIQWPTGDSVVEISDGGIDYANPDALTARYKGEFNEFSDPREAVEAAIAIAEAWQNDSPDKVIMIGHGGTCGMTMPFEGMEICEETYAALREWAQEQYEELDKCQRCGDVLGKERWTHPGLPEEDEFCSENCCENHYWDLMKEAEEGGED